tara:strand:+ start:15352 stop:15501 length:150 start_codon:yes stop_codon:yes gene_type:complete
MEGKESKTISGRIPADLHEKVRVLAEKRDRSFNYIVREALALLVEREPK